MRIKMTDIRRSDLFIPGGWYATLPDVFFHDTQLQTYAEHFRRRGMSPTEARRYARESLQKVWIRGWVAGLRQTLVYLYRIYRQQWPDLDGAGFDPETAQYLYVPGDNLTGRRGKNARSKVLQEMARREYDRRSDEAAKADYLQSKEGNGGGEDG